jgi:plasmid stabilization system protein ParE
MAEIVWTEPALTDLDAIADYIALDDSDAARGLVRRVFQHVEQLADHPRSGPRPPELKRSRYRQIVEPPCRVFYRHDKDHVYILFVMRSQQRLRARTLGARDRRRQGEQASRRPRRSASRMESRFR